MDVCTIVARNYLPYARVFVRSLRAIHPDARVTVLIVDGAADPADAGQFRSLGLADVLPDREERDRQAFMYDVLELSTAVKPLLLRKLLDEGAPSVLYFDPDVRVYQSLAALWDLARERGIVLTPHTLSPMPDDGFDIKDLAMLRAGVFNLGFIGVGSGSRAFLDWWSGRLRRYCLADSEAGMFVDQRWIDRVPALFPHVIVQDPGCNVAYWNLHERRLERRPDGVRVNGQPLRFYHFSGFHPAMPHLVSRYQGENPRVLLSEEPVLRDLCEAYAAELRAAGAGDAAEPYGFAALSDGLRIDRLMRRVYRQAVLDAERLGETPPAASFDASVMVPWFNQSADPAPKLSRYLFGLYGLRPDIQHEFPQPIGPDADAYLNWAEHDPGAIADIPDPFRPRTVSGDAPDITAPPLPWGLNIAGDVAVRLSADDVARAIAAAVRDAGIPVATVRSRWTREREAEAAGTAEPAGPYAATLVCAAADALPRATDALPREMRARSHRIGFWCWDAARVPERFAALADVLDEIWVAGDEAAEVVRAVVETPVFVCPIPPRRLDAMPMTRAEMGVPGGFLFLCVSDVLHDAARANPVGAIEAFCRAFRAGEGPTLVVVADNAHLARREAEAVRAAAAGRPDVVLVEGGLAARERDALVATCDCYVSLHRFEALGLALAEAIAAGKPVIATASSGRLSLVTPEDGWLVPWQPATMSGASESDVDVRGWADPDLAAAAAHMRFVYEHPAAAAERARQARDRVLAQLSAERTVAFVRDRLTDIEAQQAAARAAAERDAARAAEPPPPSLDEQVNAILDEASRDAGEADQQLEQGIPSGTPSPFGWLGRVIRNTVLRLLRPYSTYSTGVQRQHLRSTSRLVASIRLLQQRVTELQNRPPADPPRARKR